MRIISTVPLQPLKPPDSKPPLSDAPKERVVEVFEQYGLGPLKPDAHIVGIVCPEETQLDSAAFARAQQYIIKIIQASIHLARAERCRLVIVVVHDDLLLPEIQRKLLVLQHNTQVDAEIVVFGREPYDTENIVSVLNKSCHDLFILHMPGTAIDGFNDSEDTGCRQTPLLLQQQATDKTPLSNSPHTSYQAEAQRIIGPRVRVQTRPRYGIHVRLIDDSRIGTQRGPRRNYL